MGRLSRAANALPVGHRIGGRGARAIRLELDDASWFGTPGEFAYHSRRHSLVDRFRPATLIEAGVMKRAVYVAVGSPQTSAIYHAKGDNRDFYLG